MSRTKFVRRMIFNFLIRRTTHLPQSSKIFLIYGKRRWEDKSRSSFQWHLSPHPKYSKPDAQTSDISTTKTLPTCHDHVITDTISPSWRSWSWSQSHKIVQKYILLYSNSLTWNSRQERKFLRPEVRLKILSFIWGQQKKWLSNEKFDL